MANKKKKVELKSEPFPRENGTRYTGPPFTWENTALGGWQNPKKTKERFFQDE